MLFRSLMSLSSAELVKFLNKPRSTKEFTSEGVPQDAVDAILEVARWTGSGVNKQPWEVVVVRDNDVKAKLGDWGAKPAASAAVVMLIVSTDDSVAFDEGRFAERITLGAEAFGLGSTVATLKNEGPEQAKALLGIPAERRAKTVVVIGHPDQAAKAARVPKPGPARKPMSELAHWDRY